jgi:hypothetical protein
LDDEWREVLCFLAAGALLPPPGLAGVVGAEVLPPAGVVGVGVEALVVVVAAG